MINYIAVELFYASETTVEEPMALAWYDLSCSYLCLISEQHDVLDQLDLG